MRHALGIDLGGSSVKAVLVNAEGQIIEKRFAEFHAEAEMDWARTVLELTSTLKGLGTDRVEHLGFSAPGLAARDGFSISFMPGRLRGLENFDWTSYLNWPRKVPVLNDAHAALLGEQWVGAARGLEDVIMLTLGTGVGGAAIVDGRLLRGHIGRAGHLGHNCLDLEGKPDVTGIPGSIEMEIGNATIMERAEGKFATTLQLVRAYENGDSFARKVWLRSVKALACTLATHINALDPEAVIIGGGIARAGQSLFGPLEEFLGGIEWRPGGHKVKLLPASLGEFAGAIGAARNAFRDESQQEARTV